MRTSELVNRLFDAIVAHRRRSGALLGIAAFATAAITYTVQPGDTLSGIAKAKCGTTAQWPAIYAQNKSLIGMNPDLIYSGQQYHINCTTAVVPLAAVHVLAVTGTGLSGRLLAEARTRIGDPYVWGGTGPGSFDCSGLVFWAAGKLGISLPRDTFGMLGGSAHLHWVSSPRPGDLAFFGSGHVELWVKAGETFGAQKPGTVVGYHGYGGWYVPTEYLRLT